MAAETRSRIRDSSLGVFVLFGAWALCADVLHLNDGLLPPLSATISALVEDFRHGGLLGATTATLWRWLFGFFLGGISGAFLGYVVGLNERLFDMTRFPLEFLRTLPVTAAFPLFLLAFGIGDESKVAMVFSATVFVVWINTAFGVRNRDKLRAEMAKCHGADRLMVLRFVVIPEALPHVVLGLRLAASLSLIVVVVAEMFVGTDVGLGRKLFEAYSRNLSGLLYGVLLLTGSFGYVVNACASTIEVRLSRWIGRS